MLILTRRVGESVIIGSTVKVTILGVAGNQVRVGTDAPKQIPVHRAEVYRRIKAMESQAIPEESITPSELSVSVAPVEPPLPSDDADKDGDES